MNINEMITALKAGALDERLQSVYGEDNISGAGERILSCIEGYKDTFTDFGLAEAGLISDNDMHIFSAPGRVEICGNHTDHQNGKIIAAAVDIDMIAAACPNHEKVIRVCSMGNGFSEIDLNDLSVNPDEVGTTEAIVRGVAASLSAEGFELGGFNAYVMSSVPAGSGLSSSAAFEILMGNIISGLFNDGSIDPVTLAKAGQKAENVFFGKPSGLMDQLACSVGALIYMDLEDPASPVCEKIKADLGKEGYSICITATGGSHEDLTDAYAQIPADMGRVASYFCKSVLREVSEDEIGSNFAALISACGERAVKRAVHFMNEEERVENLRNCLLAVSKGRGGDIYEQPDETAEKLTNMQQALEIICESGDSSFRLLGNVCLPGKAAESPMAHALDLSWELLQGRGAFRVHGGGFAGTILAIVPDDLLDGYKAVIEEEFGSGSCRVLNVRSDGGCEVF